MENKNPAGDAILLEWEAPVRPFKARGKEWFTALATVLVLGSLVALLLRDFLLLGVIFALAFVSYALSANPPQKVRHQIKSRGLSFGGNFYAWEELAQFWFKPMGENLSLIVETRKRFPSQLVMLLAAEVDQEKLRQLLAAHLKLVENPKTDWVEKSTRWFSDKFRLS